MLLLLLLSGVDGVVSAVVVVAVVVITVAVVVPVNLHMALTIKLVLE